MLRLQILQWYLLKKMYLLTKKKKLVAGCDGNSNNFATREDCEGYCGVGGCPNGGTPERNEFGRLMACSSTASCPTTHECTSVNSGNSVVNRCCPTRGLFPYLWYFSEHWSATNVRMRNVGKADRSPRKCLKFDASELQWTPSITVVLWICCNPLSKIEAFCSKHYLPAFVAVTI